MKKVLLGIVALLLLALPALAEMQDMEELVEEFPVIEYMFSWDEDSNYLFMIVENNTDRNVMLEVSLKYFDGDGALVGVDNIEELAFGPGTQILVSGFNDIPFASYEYEIEAVDEPYIISAVGDFETVVTIVGEKIIVEVTNVGDEVAQNVEYDVLFFKDGEVIGTRWGALGGWELEIDPGETEYFEEYAYQPFDDAIVLFKAFRKFY